ncbi:hypothetical protein AB0K23_20405 [Streptomyces sp. NPDC049602]|uniref:hypothetical protein n=1 Tax=Streptomyces sp. NPDC049602 TaxID=3155504 RepID=UPI0034291CEF
MASRTDPESDHVGAWWQDPRVLIKGYGNGPLVAGEPLLARLGFWSNYLSFR